MLLQSLIHRHGRLITERDTLRSSATLLLESGARGLTQGPAHTLQTLIENHRVEGQADLQPILKHLHAHGLHTHYDPAQQGLPLSELKAAALLAEAAPLMRSHLEHIRLAYKQGWPTINLNIRLQEAAHRAVMTRLFFELYAAGFFTSYSSELSKDTLNVNMHPAASARKFFETGWLELWLYFQLVKNCQLQGLAYSACRGLSIDDHTGKTVRLDFACLIEGRTFIAVGACVLDHRLEHDRLRRLGDLLAPTGGALLICEPFADEVRATELCALYKLPFLNLDATIAQLLQKSGGTKHAPRLTVVKNPNRVA